MNRKSDRPYLLPELKTQMLHTLLSAVLLLPARSLISMLLPLINRTKLYFFVCVFLSHIKFFYNFWSNFFKKLTPSDFLIKVTLIDQSWKKWTSGIPASAVCIFLKIFRRICSVEVKIWANYQFWPYLALEKGRETKIFGDGFLPIPSNPIKLELPFGVGADLPILSGCSLYDMNCSVNSTFNFVPICPVSFVLETLYSMY